MQAVRKIIHVDMDAFYASVEQRDEPRYRGKPIVVGIQTGADLKQWSQSDLVHHFGKVGQYYYKIARAEDDRLVAALRVVARSDRPVQPNRICKSIGAENSYDPDLNDPPGLRASVPGRSEIETELEEVAETLLRRLDSQQATGRTLTLKVKYADYQQVTRSRTLLVPIRDRSLIMSVAHELLDMTEVEQKAVRLLGLTVSNLMGETKEHYVQLCLGI